MVIRKIHLIKKLKINILIDNDVFNSKLFDISMFNNIVYIENCNVIISIVITSHRNIHSKFVHSIKINFIFSYFENIIFIHEIFIANRDYFFESIKTVNFSTYTHLINIKINFILI